MVRVRFGRFYKFDVADLHVELFGRRTGRRIEIARTCDHSDWIDRSEGIPEKLGISTSSELSKITRRNYLFYLFVDWGI